MEGDCNSSAAAYWAAGHQYASTLFGAKQSPSASIEPVICPITGASSFVTITTQRLGLLDDVRRQVLALIDQARGDTPAPRMVHLAIP
jgi:hypothetical protein